MAEKEEKDFKEVNRPVIFHPALTDRRYGWRLDVVFLVAMLGLIALWFLGMMRNPYEQLGLFFGRCGDFLADLTNVIRYAHERDPYGNAINGFQEHAGPPLHYLLIFLFSKMIIPEAYVNNKLMWQEPTIMVLILIVLGFVTSMMMLQMYEIKNGSRFVKFLTASVMIFSGAYLFLLERGNILGFAICLCTFYLMNYDNPSPLIREFSLIALAMAAGLKLSPAALGVLTVLRGRGWESLRLMCYGLFMFFTPFLAFKGGFRNLPIMLYNLSVHAQVYANSDSNCGLYTWKIAKLNTATELAAAFLSIALSLVLIAAVPYMKQRWMKMAAVILPVIMIPSHAGQYDVVYLFPAIVLFLNEDNYTLLDIVYFFCFLALLNPSQGNALLTVLAQKPVYIMTLLFFLMGIQSSRLLFQNRCTLREDYLCLWKNLLVTLREGR